MSCWSPRREAPGAGREMCSWGAHGEPRAGSGCVPCIPEAVSDVPAACPHAVAPSCGWPQWHPGWGAHCRGAWRGRGAPMAWPSLLVPGTAVLLTDAGGDPASSGHVTGGDSTGCYLYSSLDRATHSVTPRQGPGVPGAVNPSLGTVGERGASSHEVLMPWAKAVPQGPLPCLSPVVPAPPQVTPVGWPHGVSQPPQLSPLGRGRPKGGH